VGTGVIIITCVNYPSGIFANLKSVDNIFIYGKIEPILEVALLARFVASGFVEKGRGDAPKMPLDRDDKFG
jgi:hypothetical protein